MNDIKAQFKELAALDRAGLEARHQQGVLPQLAELQGLAQGRVFNLPRLSPFRLWRGKYFRHGPDGQVEGLNRIGLAGLELRRYRFVARVADSLFSDREVLLLDHDLPGNPPRYRAFHDELVQLEPGLYLASSHIRKAGKLRYVCHFALAFTEAGQAS